MKTVYLTSGPRGSGKTEFVKRVKAYYPDIEVISRDDILIELFGSTSLNPYTGEHDDARTVIHERIRDFLVRPADCKLILDHWNGFTRDRTSMISRLKEWGADQVLCWQFVIPVERCVSWFFAKPDAKGYSESGIRSDYDLYFRMAKDIESDGFDRVYRIDPRSAITPSIMRP